MPNHGSAIAWGGGTINHRNANKKTNCQKPLAQQPPRLRKPQTFRNRRDFGSIVQLIGQIERLRWMQSEGEEMDRELTPIEQKQIEYLKNRQDELADSYIWGLAEIKEQIKLVKSGYWLNAIGGAENIK